MMSPRFFLNPFVLILSLFLCGSQASYAQPDQVNEDHVRKIYTFATIGPGKFSIELERHGSNVTVVNSSVPMNMIQSVQYSSFYCKYLVQFNDGLTASLFGLSPYLIDQLELSEGGWGTFKLYTREQPTRTRTFDSIASVVSLPSQVKPNHHDVERILFEWQGRRYHIFAEDLANSKFARIVGGSFTPEQIEEFRYDWKQRSYQLRVRGGPNVILSPLSAHVMDGRTFSALGLSRKTFSVREYREVENGRAFEAEPVYAGDPEASSNDSKRSEIWQWRIEIGRPRGASPILFTAMIYNPEVDPVLLGLASRQTLLSNKRGLTNLNLESTDIREFSQVNASYFFTEAHEKAFRIQLNRKVVEGVDGENFSIVEPQVLKEVILFFDGRVRFEFEHATVLVKPKVTKEQTNFSSLSVMLADHFRFPSSYPFEPLVFEPSTIHPLTFREYFAPKGIEFSGAMPSEKQFGWKFMQWSSEYGGPERTSAKVKIPEVRIAPRLNQASDLVLSGALKEKTAEVWALLNQTERPTIAQMIALLNGLPGVKDPNPFSKYRDAPQLNHEILRTTPALIARFEYLFPNADWYGLGRDIYFLADILDAYYIFVGQPGRVHRVPASAPSFDEKNVTAVIDFLRSNGFDFESINSRSRAKVFFDVTSFSRSEFRYSQSSQIMRAAYREWIRLGRKPQALMKKFNFISTGKFSDRTVNVEDRKQFFSRLKFDNDGPLEIPSVQNSDLLQYGQVWHGLYGPFTADESRENHVLTQPGPPSEIKTKLKILWELFVVTQTVMNNDFVALVERARQYPGVTPVPPNTACADALKSHGE